MRRADPLNDDVADFVRRAFAEQAANEPRRGVDAESALDLLRADLRRRRFVLKLEAENAQG